MTIPTVLTLTRLISSVVVLPFLIFFLVPLADPSAGIFLVIVCVVLAVTDFFDGYLARKYNQETDLGKQLDPLADKCFVISSLLPLIALQRLYFYWGLIVIIRELLVTGLRYSARCHNFSVDVTAFGKWKAAFQYAYIIFVVGSPWTLEPAMHTTFENGLLIGMVGFTFFSGILYCKSFIKQWRVATQQH